MRRILPLLLSAALGGAALPAQAQAEWLRNLADVMRAIAGHQRGAGEPTLASAGACSQAPYGQRELFLRGSFNAWAADEPWRMRWQCHRYELVAAPRGEQQFKIGDEDWSADADLGAGPQGLPELRPKGEAIRQRFDGRPMRFVLSFPEGRAPRFTMSECQLPPFGLTPIFLRGSMNNWAALEDYQLQWHCDAYYLNVRLDGRFDFKFSDAAWTKAQTVAARPDGAAALEMEGGSGNFTRQLRGEHTIALRFDAQGQPQLSIGAKTFADGSETAITDAAALGLRFDSRAIDHKSPFGAQPLGSEIRFVVGSQRPGVKALTLVVERRELSGNQEHLAYLPLARLPMRPGPHGFEASYRFAQQGIYGYWFEAETESGRYALQNNKDSVYWTREKGSMGPSSIERLPEDLKRVRRYRQTIHLPELRVPDWSADVVYYYIFPERFRNGDKANDPQPGHARYQDHGIEKHARWLERPHRPGDSGDAVYNNDFFGGDLAGIIEKLDEIKELGANTIYLTPVFRAASNHKYDTGDYRQIDPGFGSNADFRRLSDEAAKRGLRVILDTSLNHVGADSPYFDRFGNFGGLKAKTAGAFAGGKPNPASPYFDWFRFDLTQAKPEDQFQGWVGIKDLPELDKSSDSWRRFAYRDPDSVTRLWLREGAAGWRMDVAPWVPDDFWREWSAVVKAEKPDALTVAETWFDASKYFLGDQFDATMNYIFRNAVLDYAAGGKASTIYRNLELTREAYPLPMLLANMNLLSTHDQARSLHHFGIAGNPHTDGVPDAAQLAEAKQRLLLAVLFQVGFPGAPTVYYGDEVGVGGGDDPYNRATYPWPDEGGQPDLQLRAQFQRLLALRQHHEVLRRGTLSAPLLLTDELIVFRRSHQGQQALVLLNNAKAEREVRLALSGHWVDALSGEAVNPARLSLPALGGRILIAGR